MPKIICPRCNKITSVQDHIGDFICDCCQSTASDALKNEDVLVIGQWTDFSGQGGNTNFSRAAENKLQGRRAEIFGARTHDRTRRGKIATLYRQRRHLEYIKLD